jgi:exodeoxyribonuclease VII large subunit
VRAPTPSAAAEMVICTKESLLERIAAARAKALQALRYRILVARRGLSERGTERATTLMHRSIARRSQRIDDLDFQLRHLERGLLERRRQRLNELCRRLEVNDLRLRFARIRRLQELLTERLRKSLVSVFWAARRRHESLDLHLRQMSPLTVLSRGYSIVENSRGLVLTSAADAIAGEALRIRLYRGELGATVNAVKKE